MPTDQPTDAGKDREAAHALIAGLWPGKAARSQNVELATHALAAARREGQAREREASNDIHDDPRLRAYHLKAVEQARAEGARQERAKADEGALEGIARQYHELLYAVANKHPGETRHETALRYIRQAEAPCNEAKARAREPREEPTNG